MDLKQKRVLRNLLIILILLILIWLVGYFLSQKTEPYKESQITNSNINTAQQEQDGVLPDIPRIPESSKNSAKDIDPNNLPPIPEIPQ